MIWGIFILNDEDDIWLNKNCKKRYLKEQLNLKGTVGDTQ